MQLEAQIPANGNCFHATPSGDERIALSNAVHIYSHEIVLTETKLRTEEGVRGKTQ